jgi:hypothetical protein
VELYSTGSSASVLAAGSVPPENQWDTGLVVLVLLAAGWAACAGILFG